MQRDFTYIDDIVNGIMASLEKIIHLKFSIWGTTASRPDGINKAFEEELNQTANIEFLKIQPGDVEVTYANIDHAKEKLNYKPKISIKEGILNLLNGLLNTMNCKRKPSAHQICSLILYRLR